jgi:hypothetical protein
LDCLPRAFSTPLYWPLGAFRDLLHRDRSSAAKALQSVRAAAGLFLRLRMTARAVSAAAPAPAAGAGAGIGTLSPSWGEFRWAMAATTTRQNRIPIPGAAGEALGSALALVPGWDFINHDGSLPPSTSFGAEAEADGNGNGNGGAGDARLLFTAARGFSAGDEILMNYGSRSNVDLLVYAGFAVPGNSADAVSVEAALPSDLGRLRVLLFERLLELCALHDSVKGDTSCGPHRLGTDADGSQHVLYAFSRLPAECRGERGAGLPPVSLCAAIAAALTKEESGVMLKDILGRKYAPDQEGGDSPPPHAVEFCRTIIESFPVETRAKIRTFLSESVARAASSLVLKPVRPVSGADSSRGENDGCDDLVTSLNSYFTTLIEGKLELAAEFSCAVVSLFDSFSSPLMPPAPPTIS